MPVFPSPSREGRGQSELPRGKKRKRFSELSGLVSSVQRTEDGGFQDALHLNAAAHRALKGLQF